MSVGWRQYILDWGSTLWYGGLGLIPLTKLAVTRGFSVKPRHVRPPVLDDPQLGTHHFAKLEGVKLHYVSNGDREKPLVLFIHGYPEFWYSWRHQLKDLSKDYWTVALDMRGYSESDKPSGVASYAINKVVEDMRQFIQHLGRQKCTVVSHDWGGIIAFSLASKYPDVVERLVVCNAVHLKPFETHIRDSPEQRKMSWYMFMYQWPMMPELLTRANDLAAIKNLFTGRTMGCKKGKITDEDIEAFKYTFREYGDLTGPINFYRAMWRYRADESYHGRIKPPTLLIWGTGDKALGVDVAKGSLTFCDDYKVKYIDGASHWVQQDCPEEVNKEIREFIHSNL